MAKQHLLKSDVRSTLSQYGGDSSQPGLRLAFVSVGGAVLEGDTSGSRGKWFSVFIKLSAATSRSNVQCTGLCSAP